MRQSRRFKRTVDVLGAAIGLVILSPLLALVGILILATMGTPVLFRQQRPGLGGRLFTLIKFRTMRAPEEGQSVYRTDNLRLTRLGRALRKLSLDELPELWNVLRGDMSLVGPRPLLPEYLQKYTPTQARRHEVLPGITGWAQINGRQAIPFSRRLELDVWYVDNWSNWLDLRILFITIVRIFRPVDVISGQNVDQVDDLGLLQAPKSINDRTQRMQ